MLYCLPSTLDEEMLQTTQWRALFVMHGTKMLCVEFREHVAASIFKRRTISASSKVCTCVTRSKKLVKSKPHVAKSN